MVPSMTTHTPAEELSVRALIARYCMSVDDGRFGDFERLWRADAVLHVMGTSHAGVPAIRAFMEGVQAPEARGRHATSSHLVVHDPEGDALVGWCDYVFFDGRNTVTSVGRYHDRYARDDDGTWRFALREIVFRGDSPELTAPPP